jgi:uncharacterized 2Fe-2S/4Fe-4S cluster protein (DUF4445 family)
MGAYRVDFEPIGKRIDVAPDTTLLEAAQQAGIVLTSTCGGMRSCGKCRVVVLEGRVSPASEDERNLLTEAELQSGQRLACNTRVQSRVKVHIPATSLATGQRLQIAGNSAGAGVDPLIRAYSLEMPPPTLHDPRSDLQRLSAAMPVALPQVAHTSLSVIRQISETVRAHDWRLTAYLREGELVGVAPPDLPTVGLAVDLGTTKIAASLVDLTTGAELAVTGALNPQIGYGEDVVSRLTYAWKKPDGGHILAAAVSETLDTLLGKLTAQAGVDRTQVADICLVGNTAMTHLLLELPVQQLASAPYIAAAHTALDVRAGELGLAAAPGAYVHVLPGIGGYVGADHVAMILASGIDQTGQVTLGIDVGTNTEIVLARPDRGLLTSASCASGPAFEGAHISDGMRAAAGAIEAVALTESGVQLKTVDGAPAAGLCGSGIIDGVAELRRWNVINARGRFDRDHPWVRAGASGGPRDLEFVLAPGGQGGVQRDITITQNDINEIQLAKGAIRAGLEILLDATDTAVEDVREVIIAGAFGTFLNVKSALDIGLLPLLPNAHYRQVGNAALVGARHALLSRQMRQRTQEIAGRTHYLELTTYPKFNRRFALAMQFPNL